VFLYYDPIYLLIILVSVALAGFAQWRVKSAYGKWSRVRNGRGVTGAQVAGVLMRNEGLMHLQTEQIAGTMTDHYDPRSKTMRLSAGSVEQPSVAAMAIVAHELGHAAQDKEGYPWLRLRSSIVGVVNIGTNLGWILIMIGVFLGVASGAGEFILWLGIICMATGVAFSLITLPVEFNASARARAMLERNQLVSQEDAAGVRSVLDAAALTYVAAAATAVLQLLYYVSLARRSSR
jgi:Zn-dependent membrane protease YugP